MSFQPAEAVLQEWQGQLAEALDRATAVAEAAQPEAPAAYDFGSLESLQRSLGAGRETSRK